MQPGIQKHLDRCQCLEKCVSRMARRHLNLSTWTKLTKVCFMRHRSLCQILLAQSLPPKDFSKAFRSKCFAMISEFSLDTPRWQLQQQAASRISQAQKSTTRKTKPGIKACFCKTARRHLLLAHVLSCFI